MLSSLSTNTMSCRYIAVPAAEYPTADEHKKNDQTNSKKNTNHVGEIYPGKCMSKGSALPTSFEQDYLGLCVDSAPFFEPVDKVARYHVTGSQDRCEREMSLNMLHYRLRLLDEDIKDDIKKNFKDAINVFSHEYRIAEVLNRESYVNSQKSLNAYLPMSFNDIIEPCDFMDYGLLESMVFLLAESKTSFHFTSTLFFINEHKEDLLETHEAINSLSKLHLDIAIKKLKNLPMDHKVMIPLLLLHESESGGISLEGHHSAILVIKKKTGFVFNIFDSKDAGQENPDKELLINRLITENSQNEIRYFGGSFQLTNDCGIHTYNYFRLCVELPTSALHSIEHMRQLTKNYVSNIDKYNNLFEGNFAATSRLLRRFIILDAIKHGYTQQFAENNALGFTGNLIQNLDEDGKQQDKTNSCSVACSSTFWQRLRRSSSLTFSTCTKGQ